MDKSGKMGMRHEIQEGGKEGRGVAEDSDMTKTGGFLWKIKSGK